MVHPAHLHQHTRAARARKSANAVSHRLPDGVRTNVFYRSAINSHNNAIIMPWLCHNYGILRHFCKNNVCSDPVWKPVSFCQRGLRGAERSAGGKQQHRRAPCSQDSSKRLHTIHQAIGHITWLPFVYIIVYISSTKQALNAGRALQAAKEARKRQRKSKNTERRRTYYVHICIHISHYTPAIIISYYVISLHYHTIRIQQSY